MKHILSRLAFVLVFSAFALVLQAQTETPATTPDQTPTKPKGITVSGPAGVNISGPTTICKGGETILKAEGDYESFEWNTGDVYKRQVQDDPIQPLIRIAAQRSLFQKKHCEE